MKKLNILSFGAGVQSTTLLAMYLNNEFEEKLDAVIFADTGFEPEAVYDNVKNWRDQCENGINPVPFYVVSKGNIKDDALSGSRFASMPFFIRNKEGKPSILRRQCTGEYKIKPVKKKIRELFGLSKGKHFKKGMSYNLILGISLDEKERMNPSTAKYETTVYPLIDKRMNRSDCYRYLLDNVGFIPQKSSCICCPFHDNKTWASMPKSELNEAIQFEKDINERKLESIDADYLYLHPSLKPLSEVDLENNQTDLGFGFINECQGGCGL